jgi:hypothetical protein
VVQLVGMSASQAPRTVPFMVAAECVTAGGIMSRGGPVAHSGKFCPTEQRRLRHDIIFPHPAHECEQSI